MMMNMGHMSGKPSTLGKPTWISGNRNMSTMNHSISIHPVSIIAKPKGASQPNLHCLPWGSPLLRTPNRCLAVKHPHVWTSAVGSASNPPSHLGNFLGICAIFHPSTFLPFYRHKQTPPKWVYYVYVQYIDVFFWCWKLSLHPKGHWNLWKPSEAVMEHPNSQVAGGLIAWAKPNLEGSHWNPWSKSTAFKAALIASFCWELKSS